MLFNSMNEALDRFIHIRHYGNERTDVLDITDRIKGQDNLD